MTGPRQTIRSYQRIFSPDRRLYAIEGHPLPIPGGVPLRWLGYASSALLAVLVLGSGSPAIAASLARGAAAIGLGVGGWPAAARAAAGGLAGFEVAAALLGLVDWPLRLIVIPAGIATLATQATPDGRRAHRFAVSWLLLRMAPRRRSLARGLPMAAGRGAIFEGGAWIAADEAATPMRRGRVRGPATVRFGAPVEVRRRGGRIRASRLGLRARRGAIVEEVEVEARQRLEVRP